ncbi:MAG: hypothetical protein ACK5NF_02765, partial [Bacilli bacterium]
MRLLIISDNDSNKLYNSIETGSIGYYSNIFLDDIDYSLIINNMKNISILAYINDDNGVRKLFFANLKKVEKNGDNYNLTYIILHVVANLQDINNFVHAFPYAF